MDEQRVPTTADGINFRGRILTQQKHFWYGTHRSRSPAETLEIIKGFYFQAGITRLADITGLDRIGISTILSIRPNAKTLTVSAGKGFTRDAACASAAMEAIEIYHAENADLAHVRCSWKDLSSKHSVPAVESLPLTKHSLFTPDWPYHWAFGWDIINLCEVASPLFTIHMGKDSRRLTEFGAFQVSSNGLASGNNPLEAITAGLLEVIERDATTIWRMAWQEAGLAPPLVNDESIHDPLVRSLLDQLEAVGIGTLLFNCTLDTEVPVFLAYIFDRLNPKIGIYKGYGAHLDPSIAAIRAITEAVQGRVIYIAGSRDDLFKQQYLLMKHSDSGRIVRELRNQSGVQQWNEATPEVCQTFEEDIQILCQKLCNVGLRSVVVHDLTQATCPVSVAKVVVPGTEGYIFDSYKPGPRVAEFIRQRTA